MGLPEILIIAVVLLVLFGAKRIPALMKGIGKGINDFNKEKNAKDDDDLN
jgi:sec-independent protein translocase protein TatA